MLPTKVALEITRMVVGLPLALTLGSDTRNKSNQSLTNPQARATHLGYVRGRVTFGVDEPTATLPRRNIMQPIYPDIIILTCTQ